MTPLPIGAPVDDESAKSNAERSSGTVRHASAPPQGPRTPDTHRAQTSFCTLAELSRELVVLHRDGHVVYANRAAIRALGLDSAEISAAPLAQLFHVDDRPTVAARLVPPGARAAHETFTLRWLRTQGGYRTTEAVSALVDFDGTETALIVAHDLTDRVEFQHQLLERDRMAALGTLSAGVAHEINNPLTYLLVNLEHVLRRLRAASASDDPIAELAAGTGHAALVALVQSLQHAVDGANRVRQIVRDLLTFSQGNVERRGVVDVRGIVESAVQMAWHEIRHRARLVKTLAEVPPVEANAARLGQVFLSLLVNAAQAIPDGQADEHEIRVSTFVDEHGKTVVEVSDTGAGIAPEDLPQIFDPFFTTKGGNKPGLGLAISHGTITALKGEIRVKSAPGRGTTFRVTLPSGKALSVSALPASDHDAGALPRPTMLVIDDERLVADAIARFLSDDNDVEVVTDARQALDRIRAGQRYDVVLCDLMMPVMTGMDFYAEVVRIAPKLAGRILFMTGGTFTPRAHAFVENMAISCLEKPLDMGKLRSLLARAGRE